MNLLKALFTTSSMTLISRVLGYVREVIIAFLFGAGMATDAFFVAFKLPNLLRRIFAEGAFSQAFVPILGEYKEKRDFSDIQTLINRVATGLFLALALVTLLGVLGAAWIIHLTAPGFAAQAEKLALASSMLRITFPYILLISLVSLAGSILNSYNRFAVTAFTPALFNAVTILFALFLTPYFDPPALVLAWGVLAGGLIQLLFQVPFLWRLRLLPRPQSGFWRDEGVRRILTLMAPAILGVSVAQISLIINTVVASLLATGSVSWISYADRLMEFPTAMLGVTLGTIILPSLSRYFAAEQHHEYSLLLDWGLRLTCMLALPAALARGLLAAPLVAPLFHHGQFTPRDVLMSAEALLGYSIGLLGLVAVKILAPGFYARQNVRTPVKIAILTLILTQIVSLSLVFGLDWGVMGLTLAISLGACFNAGVLLVQLIRQRIYQPQPGWLWFTVKVLLALGVMGGVLWWLRGDASQWTQSGTALLRAAKLLGLVVAGAASYFAVLLLLGFRPRDFARRGAS